MATVPEEQRGYVVAHLHERLTEDPRANEQGVHVEITGDKVFLTGCVTTPDRRDQVAEIVREMLPHAEIHNGTTVCGWDDAPDVEDLT